MQKIETIHERISVLVNEYGDRKNTVFADLIGENEANIRGYRTKIIPKYPVLEKIVKSLDVSAEWLLTGNGPMKKEIDPTINQNGVGVPYFDVDFCGGFDMMLNDQTAVPTGYINFPQYNRADSWANISGHSMEPLISHGDIIALRKIEDWQTFILYGEIYGIMTEEYRTVKRIRKSDNPDNLLLEPINKGYDSTEIPKAVITGVWQVLGCAKRLF